MFFLVIPIIILVYYLVRRYLWKRDFKRNAILVRTVAKEKKLFEFKLLRKFFTTMRDYIWPATEDTRTNRAVFSETPLPLGAEEFIRGSDIQGNGDLLSDALSTEMYNEDLFIGQTMRLPSTHMEGSRDLRIVNHWTRRRSNSSESDTDSSTSSTENETCRLLMSHSESGSETESKRNALADAHVNIALAYLPSPSNSYSSLGTYKSSLRHPVDTTSNLSEKHNSFSPSLIREDLLIDFGT